MGSDRGEDKSGLRRFQEAVPAVVLTGVGDRIGGPAGGMLAAGLIPYGADFFGKVMAEFGKDTGRRASDMMTSAQETLGCEPDELSDLATKSERARLLTTTATLGAARTIWPGKVQALGRALAAGLIAEDDDKINLTDMALAAMAEMERPHVTLLELLVCFVPDPTDVNSNPLPYERFFDDDVPWVVGDRAWSSRQIIVARPQIAPAFLGIIQTVTRNAVVVERDTTTDAFGQFSRSAVAFLRRLADRQQRGLPALPDGPGVPRVTRRWSPTEFGEQVINYYREAGAEAEIA